MHWAFMLFLHTTDFSTLSEQLVLIYWINWMKLRLF